LYSPEPHPTPITAVKEYSTMKTRLTKRGITKDHAEKLELFDDFVSELRESGLEIETLSQFEDRVTPIETEGTEYTNRMKVMLLNPENPDSARIHLYLNGRNVGAFKMLKVAKSYGFTVGDIFIRYHLQDSGTVQVRLDFPEGN
jgi:hypothetical protein